MLINPIDWYIFGEESGNFNRTSLEWKFKGEKFPHSKRALVGHMNLQQKAAWPNFNFRYIIDI